MSGFGYLPRVSFRSFWRSLPAAIVVFLGMFTCAWGQTPLSNNGSSTVRVFNSDLAVLEAGEVRKEISCTVTPTKPALGFDLKFHSGYEVNVPLRDLAGSENTLTILFRVAPDNRRDEPLYFVQRIRVPVIEEDARGDAYLQGFFDLGEGKYHVDWLMRDRTERVCSSYWDSEAALSDKDRQVSVVIPPGSIQRAEGEQFRDEPPIERLQTDPPLDIKVLVNFAPQNPNSAALRPMDTTALVSILRSISREPRIGKFSIVAFNMQEQRILYRAENATRIDFPALGDALSKISLGTVDLNRLAKKHGETEFLTELIQKELACGDHHDAMIFAGPKVMLEENVSQDSLKPLAGLEFPMFYMNYNLNPTAVPWRDSISRAVKYFRGTEFTITRPRDLWNAVTDMVSRIVKSKQTRVAGSVSSQ